MPNTVNYVTRFEQQLMQQYNRELCTAGLTTENISFVNAKTVKIPYITLGGYKDHNRNGGFNRQSAANEYMTKTLEHDRDVEFFVDAMDVDESNEALSAANITSVFEKEHAIPETDAYRLSKLYSEFEDVGGTVDHTVLTLENILSIFDKWMETMDDAEVPEEGRFLYVTPQVNTIIKQADKITRTLDVSAQRNIDRRVRSLDDVTIKPIPSGRMKSAYDFTDGFVPAADAVQMNMILIHPSAVLACDKHSYINLWAPGSHTNGDGYLYQNRKYGDLFVLDTRKAGIMINADASVGG